MKITELDRIELLQLIRSIFPYHGFQSPGSVINHYEKNKIGKQSTTRALWDMFSISTNPQYNELLPTDYISPINSSDWLKRVYSYANDDHILTALKWVWNNFENTDY